MLRRNPSPPPDARRRFLLISAWVVPGVGGVGALVGYLSGGRTAAIWLGVLFCIVLVIALAIVYVWAVANRAPPH